MLLLAVLSTLVLGSHTFGPQPSGPHLGFLLILSFELVPDIVLVIWGQLARRVLELGR